MKTLRLNEVLGDNQIFTRIMSQHTDLPWSEDETVTAAILDFEYLYNFSGNKITAPAVDLNLGTDDKIKTAAFNMLCEVAYMMFNKKWARNWAVLTADYNPLNNYDMVETETPAEITHTLTPAETTTTDTPAETTRSMKPPKVTAENDVSAFNSGSYEDSSKTTTTGDPNDKGTEELTVDSAATYEIDVNSAGSDVLTVQNDRELRRSGNIGVTSSVQLLQQDIDLWKWNFFYEVFRDIDSVFTISTY